MSGRKENKSKKRIRTDTRYYNRIYRRDLPPFDLNSQEFRFRVIRPDRTNFDISGILESAEWRDEGNQDDLNQIPVLRGSVTLRKPHPSDPLNRVKIVDGYVIRCLVRWGGRWREVWQMRIQNVSTSVASGTMVCELADDLVLLSKSRFTYKFKQGEKKRKKGWRYWEIVRQVARKSRFKLDRKMPKGSLWIKDFQEKDISPLEAVRQVVQKEEEWSGRPHIIYWRDGRLHIKRLRRNPLLYTLAGQIREADIKVSRKAQHFTAATGTGTSKRKSKRDDKKVTSQIIHKEVSKKARRRYGYIHADIKLGSKVDSRKEAKRIVKRKIAKSIRPNRVIEGFTHGGIAFIRRGDAVKVRIPHEGIKGKKSILFVTTVAHSLSGGDYTMTLDMTLNDPLDPNELREAREEAARRRKRAQKGKKDDKKDDS